MGENFREKNQQPECGKETGKLCSELFLERYDTEKIRDLLLELQVQLGPKARNIFGGSKINEQNNKVNADFLSNYSNKIFEHIKKRLLESEESLINYTSYNLHNTISDFVFAYLIPNDVERIRIKRHIRTEGSTNKVVCGKSTGILCSELFKQTYTTDRLVGLIYSFKGSQKYNFIFDEWPKDEDGNFETEYITLRARTFQEEILGEIKRSETNDQNYVMRNFHYMIRLKTRSFLLRERPPWGKMRQKTVNKKLIERYHCKL